MKDLELFYQMYVFEIKILHFVVIKRSCYLDGPNNAGLLSRDRSYEAPGQDREHLSLCNGYSLLIYDLNDIETYLIEDVCA